MTDTTASDSPSAQTTPPASGKSLLTLLWEYKETIVTICTILGIVGSAAAWAFAYFATKNQLDETKCLMKQNIAIVEARMDSANFSQLMVQNLEETADLEGKGTLTPAEILKHNQLKAAAVDIGQKLSDANTNMTKALEKLKQGECAHPSEK